MRIVPTMGQAERDRINVKRGGSAGLPYLIGKGEAAATAAASYSASKGGGTAAGGSAGVNVDNPTAAAVGKIYPVSSKVPGTIGGFDLQNILKSYNEGFTSAKTANEQRYNDILTGYKDLGGSIQGKMGADYESALAALQGDKSRVLSDMSEGYGRTKALLAGMGAQESSDIRESYGAQKENALQRLREQGMDGTIVAPSVLTGITREERADQGRLGERLRREQVGAEQFWIPTLGAEQNRYNTMRYNLQNQFQGGGTEAALGLGRDTLGFKERREDEYPDLGAYSNILFKLGESGGAGGMGGAGGYGASSGLGRSGKTVTPYVGALSTPMTRFNDSGPWGAPRPMSAKELEEYRRMGTLGGGYKVWG